MADPVVAGTIRSMPRIEPHVHLGGSISAATALTLAERHGVDPADLPIGNGRYPERYDGFPPFLAALMAADGVARTADDLELVAATFARDRLAQGVGSPPAGGAHRRVGILG